MKKMFLLAALVGVAFTSCVKNEEHVTPDQPKPITFEPAKYKPVSGRAEVAFPQQESFGTFAFYRTTAVASEDHSVFMDNVKVSYVAAENPYWAPNGHLYYWPESAGSHLDFISYFPYNEVKTAASVPQISMSDQQQTMVYRDFVVDQATDLMYSDKAMQQTRNTLNYGFTGVPTLFRHALAKLNFKVKATMMDNSATAQPGNVTSWVVTLKKIQLDGIYSKGTLTLKTTNVHEQAGTVQWTNATTQGFNVWDAPATPISKEWAYNQVLTTTASEYTDGTAPASNYFVLPQAFVAGGQSITIEYAITTTTPGGQVGTAEKTKTVHFINYPAVSAWELGKSITYTIQIDPEGDVIHFAPAIWDWETGDGVLDL